jgi:hypothetical protein
VSNVIEAETQVYVKGTYMTIDEVRERYALAITINNEEIVKALYSADHPMSTLEIAALIKPKHADATKDSVKQGLGKLCKNKLAVRFRTRRNALYLLSRKGAVMYQQQHGR